MFFLQVNLDPNIRNIQELKTWPEFHNAVAAGLRLAPLQVCVLYCLDILMYLLLWIYKMLKEYVTKLLYRISQCMFVM